MQIKRDFQLKNETREEKEAKLKRKRAQDAARQYNKRIRDGLGCRRLLGCAQARNPNKKCSCHVYSGAGGRQKGRLMVERDLIEAEQTARNALYNGATTPPEEGLSSVVAAECP